MNMLSLFILLGLGVLALLLVGGIVLLVVGKRH
jgi:hypothetical protein